MNRPALSLAIPTLAAALLVATALPATAQSTARVQPEQAATRLVQISLLAASKAGPNQLSDLPANARQAIHDIQQFLPFKSYRLLDTALVRTSRGARTMLRGPNDGDFRVAMDFAENLQNGKLQVLRFELVEYSRELPATLAEDMVRRSQDPSAPALAPRAPAGPVITTSFSAEIGQTVVVGSSRLNGGDEALIVLFTALP